MGAQPKDATAWNTGSIHLKEIMADTSRTLINLQRDEERLTINRDSLTQSMMSTQNFNIVDKFEDFASQQVSMWTMFLKKVEKATYSARGNESLVDKCIDFKRRGEMSIKILTESLERLRKDKRLENIKS